MATLQDIYARLESLSEGSPEDKRRRGREFELLLGELLQRESLEPRIRLRPTGEEIDGSFHFEFRTYLVEAKWHANPLPASAIYAFKGKVDGKLAGTIGVFISMSGYAEDAVDALTTGKDLNVVLFDRNDIEAALEHTFMRVLRAKLRAATEEGVVFYPFTSTLAEVTREAAVRESDAPTDVPALAKKGNQVAIVCEGSADVRILNRLAQRILEAESLSASLQIVVAQGKRGVPRVANAIYPLLPKATPLIVIVDSDGDVEQTSRFVREQLSVPFHLIVVHPEIEAWLEPGSDNPKNELKKKAKDANMPFDDYVRRRTESASVHKLSDDSPSFRAFFELVVKAASPRRVSLT